MCGKVASRDQNFYLPLYKAALQDDWVAANAFLVDEPDAKTAKITAFEETALQVAASVGHASFVEKLMENMSDEALQMMLEMKDSIGHTALFFAVLADCTEAVKAMVEKNPHLTLITNLKNLVPLHYAPLYGGKEMTKFLCSATEKEDPNFFKGETSGRLINDIIGSGFYDIALDLLKRYPQLATGRDEKGITALDMLAQRPSAFKSGSRLGFFGRCIYSCVIVKQVAIPQHPTGGDGENPSVSCGEQVGTPQHATGGDAENPSVSCGEQVRTPQHPTGGDAENPSVSCGEQAGTPQHPTEGDAENPYVSCGAQVGTPQQVKNHYESCGDLRRLPNLFNINKVPIVKQVHDVKLMHAQVLELLKFICKQLSSMNNSKQIVEYFLHAKILSTATQNGIVELIRECTQNFPDLVWMKTKEHSIFHMAVLHRQEKIFNLIHGMSANRKLLISAKINGNNILHMAARLAPSSELNSIPGAALQMQRELQWFKEVEKIMDPPSKDLKNKQGKTPRALFSEQHKHLLEKGEKWMRDTATSCMVVSTLIATVLFTAAFNVPGGYKSDKGIPIFLKDKFFRVFIVSDEIGLFTSCASVLMFLSILTARYSEEDFLESLPTKLIIGLTTLFISIAALLTAFGATRVIMLDTRDKQVVVTVMFFACLPVTLFALLHIPLFLEMVRSTYCSGIFHRRAEHIIY